MKKVLLLWVVILLAYTGNSQVLVKDPDTGRFAFSELVQTDKTTNFIRNKFEEIAYESISETDTKVIAKGQINEIVGGFTVEITYSASFEKAADGYKMLLTGFKVADFKGTYVLEDMGGYQKKWLRKINLRLPGIIKILKNNL